MLCRLMEAGSLFGVAAGEEADRVEGAAALEISIAAIRPDCPQRHCATGDNS